MVLNYIWISFFVIGFIIALFKLFFLGDTQIFATIINGTFDSAKSGFDISLGLTGVLTLWMGIMKIGENGGMVALFSKAIQPFFQKLFPEIPKNHPVNGSIMMNFAANMLGLDNAATPLGLKAMDQLQALNTQKERASNPMIMFLVLNTSGLTIIPISIFVYRAQCGAANPTDIFVPILLATFFSTIAGIISVAIMQKINLFNRVILLYLGGLTAAIVGLIVYLSKLSQNEVMVFSSQFANITLFTIIISFIVLAAFKRINVYESFIEGAKEGFTIAIKIIPYLVAMLVAIGIFRNSGAMDMLIGGIKWFVEIIGGNTRFVEALPTALMKPLSGSAARGMMIETMNVYGADSFVGRVSSIVQGATDTTFYIIAVYFGAAGIKNTRYAIQCGLIADFVGITAAILLGYLFFG